MTIRCMIVTTLYLSIACASPLLAGENGGYPAGIIEGIDALRQGRFTQAGDRFAWISREAPLAAEGPFFEAFLIWWRLLDRTSPQEAGPMRLLMEEHLAHAVKRARAMIDSPDPLERQRAGSFLGTALMLDAQSKAARGAHLAAASSARQGHQALSAVLGRQPDSPDALFAMGVYNYYADHVSVFVKGLRLFLLIPGGDAVRGLSQLETAAQRSRMFGTESLLLLAHIHSGNYERDFGKALDFVNRARERHSESPLISLIRADLLFRLGRLREASVSAADALRMVRTTPGYSEDLESLAAHRISACTLELHDPLTAVAQMEELLKTPPAGSAMTRKRLASLLVAAARESGAPQRGISPLERITLPADEKEALRRRLQSSRLDPHAAPRAAALQSFARGRVSEAMLEIKALLTANPLDLRLHYDYGRMLQLQGRTDEAATHLEFAANARAGSRHADIAGWALLRLGWASEIAGKRAAALEFYRRASEMKQFTFQPAALNLLDHPASSQPEG